MLKNIYLLLISLSLVTTLSACTSTEVANEDADAAAISDESSEIAEGEDPFGMDEGLSGDSTDMASNDLAPDEQLPEDQGGDPFASTDQGGDPFATNDLGADSDPFAEPATGDSSEVAGADPFAEPAAGATENDPFAEPATDGGSMAQTEDVPPPTDFADSMSAPIEEPAGPAIEDGATTFADSTGIEDAPVKRNIPVTKIADAPYQQNGILVNAVYIARPGDTVAGISEKIYGTSDRAGDLRKINPSLKGKTVKTGTKVYYNSPNRPDDNTNLLTFYEDIGLSPEIYVSKDGDNIRTISQALLGDPNSWKEVWATNPNVESKGELEAGQQLRYWAATDVPSMASAPPPPAPNLGDMGTPPPPPDEVAMNDIQAPPPLPEDAGYPPPPDMAQNDMLPPTAGMVEPPPPPPPPTEMMVEPPPPPPAPSPNRMAAKADAGGDDETLILGVGAVCLLAAVGMFIVLRKKRARRQLDFNTSTQTQIE